MKRTWIPIICLVVCAILLSTAMHRAKIRQRNHFCNVYLGWVAIGVNKYSQEIGQSTNLNVLNILNDRPDLMMRFSGICAAVHPRFKRTIPLSGEASDYEYLDSFSVTDHPMNLPIAWDKKGNHKGGRYVGFLHGSSKFMAEAEFQTLLDSHRINYNEKKQAQLKVSQ